MSENSNYKDIINQFNSINNISTDSKKSLIKNINTLKREDFINIANQIPEFFCKFDIILKFFINLYENNSKVSIYSITSLNNLSDRLLKQLERKDITEEERLLLLNIIYDNCKTIASINEKNTELMDTILKIGAGLGCILLGAVVAKNLNSSKPNIPKIEPTSKTDLKKQI